MRIEIVVPSERELRQLTFYPVRLAPRGEKWSELCLGDNRRHKGVYLIWHGGHIVYIGKTDGAKMSFGVRLRREFQESASGGRHIYPKLVTLQRPEITVCLLPTDILRTMVHLDSGSMTDRQLISMCEAAFIAAYKPVFQFDVEASV